MNRGHSTVPDLAALSIDERARGKGSTRKRRGLLVVALGLIAAAIGLTLAFKKQKPLVEVALAQPAGGEQRATLLNASGYVTPRRRATVAAKITGRATAVHAEEGMRVRAGQVLATLDDSDARARLISAKAERDVAVAAIADLEVNLANAERELRRTEGLAAAGIRSAQALDLARTTAESLRARLEAAREQVRAAEARIAVGQQDLENTIIRAPFDGLVVSKDAQVGEMVSPLSAGGGFTRTGIATIVDMKSLEIEVDVNESYIARVKPGQPVVAKLNAYPDWQIPAKVRTVIPTADRQKATVKVRIAFDALEPRILPDMGVKVAFLSHSMAEARSGAEVGAPKALVPSEAVRQENGKPVVYRVRDDRLERRAVSLGATLGNGVEISAGIAVGDRVVVMGPTELRNGQAAQIKR
jgi:RND family efflux transporter MFP subunit